MISEQAVERYRPAAESIGIRLEWSDGVVLHGGMAICSEPELHGYIRGWQRSGAKCDWKQESAPRPRHSLRIPIDDDHPVAGEVCLLDCSPDRDDDVVVQYTKYSKYLVRPTDVVAAR